MKHTFRSEDSSTDQSYAKGHGWKDGFTVCLTEKGKTKDVRRASSWKCVLVVHNDTQGVAYSSESITRVYHKYIRILLVMI